MKTMENCFPGNFSIDSLETAVAETRSRVRFLIKISKSKHSLFTSKMCRDVVWRINRSYHDWKEWRTAIAATLCEESYPELAVAMLRSTADKPFVKDDATFKLLRNLIGTIGCFGEFKGFTQLLAKDGAVEPIMAFISKESSNTKVLPEIVTRPKIIDMPTASDNTFFIRNCLRTLLNIMKFAGHNEAISKAGGAHIFATLMDLPYGSVNCFAGLCLLRMLYANKPPTTDVKFVDDKNISKVFIEALLALKTPNTSKIPPDSLVEGLVTIGQNHVNMRRLLQNGIIETMCELLHSHVEAVQLHGVELFLGLFAERPKLGQHSFSNEEFRTIWKRLFRMDSSTVETMPVLTARKILTNIKKLRNDPDDEIASGDEESLATPPSSGGTKQGSPVSSNETVRENQASEDRSSLIKFKGNHEISELADAISETRIRVQFLSKLHDLSPLSIVCQTSIQSVEGLGASFLNWDVEWHQTIINTLLQENYPDIALKLATLLSKQTLEKPSAGNFNLLLMLYSHVNNILQISLEARKAFAEAGFLPFLLEYLGKTSRTVDLLSANTLEVVYRSTAILLHLIQSHNLKLLFYHSKMILAAFLKRPKLSVVVSMCLANLVPDTIEAVKFAEEKTIAKKIMAEVLSTVAREQKLEPNNALRLDSRMYSTKDLLDSIRILAINDEGTKQTIMENGAIELISKLLTSKCPSKKATGLELAWTLSFEPKFGNLIKKSLLTTIEGLTQSEDASLRQKASLTMNFVEKSEKFLLKNATEVQLQPDYQLFISCSSEKYDTCKNLCYILEQRGLCVKIDNKYQAQADWLGKMAQRIECSAAVLVCLSDSYKVSNMCRVEAEYAKKLSKQIIAINLDSSYSPDGWLRKLVQDPKVTMIKGKKFDSEAVIKQIVRQFDPLEEPESPSSPNSAHAKPLTSVTRHTRPAKLRKASDDSSSSSAENSNLAKWSKTEVKKWLEKEQLLQKYGPKMDEFDGEKLALLLEIKTRAPEYYYESLTKHFNDSLPNMLQLFAAFGRLSSN